MTQRRHKSDTKTRRKILDHLKLAGSLDAESLAGLLGISAMGVRQHLYSLAEEGLVTYSEEARPLGRPAKHWQLTEAASAFFPDGHQDLAVGLIGALGELFGEDGMQKLLCQRLHQQLDLYAQILEKASTLPQKLTALAKQRTKEGYMARWEKLGDGRYLLIENHCPICSAAKACQGLCAMELELFKKALGPDVYLERSDHIIAGARRCAYLVQEKALP